MFPMQERQLSISSLFKNTSIMPLGVFLVFYTLTKSYSIALNQMGYQENIFSLFFQENLCWGYSLEVSRQQFWVGKKDIWTYAYLTCKSSSHKSESPLSHITAMVIDCERRLIMKSFRSFFLRCSDSSMAVVSYWKKNVDKYWLTT